MNRTIEVLAYYAFHLTIWAGTAVAVFGLGKSGWWFCLAFFVSLCFSKVSHE